MDQKQIIKQMIQFNKTDFDNTLISMISMQERTERLISTHLELTPMIPAEGRKVIANWVRTYKKGCEEFKATVEGSYRKVEDFFAPCDKGSRST